MKLVIDISATDRTNSLVTSVTDTAQVSSVQTLILGNSEPLDIKFTDSSLATPASPAWAGAAGYTLAVGLGSLDSNALLCHTSTTSFTTQSGGWTGRLSLATEDLKEAVNLASSVPGFANIATDPRARNTRPTAVWMWLEVQVIDSAGQPISYAIIRVPVLNRTLPESASTVADPNTEAYAWLLSNFVINASTVTALTGGGATCLDGYEDTHLPTNCIVEISYSNVSQRWKLAASTASTDITATPARVRAKNYSTNNRVWFQIG
jgi:hypothetical protein